MKLIDVTAELEKAPKYVGTKHVQAFHMTRGEYNAFRGWPMPAGEIASDTGYLIRYLDGQASNIEGIAGYVTWSPSMPFEAAYVVADTHAQRMGYELLCLNEKIELLEAFMDTETFEGLPSVDKNLLTAQGTAMVTYATILETRIERVTPARLGEAAPGDE